MTLPISETGRLASEQDIVKLNGVFKILKYNKTFSVQKMVKRIRIGDPGLTIGGGWTIGGYSIVENSSSWISHNTGTTTRITQGLNPERAQGTSVTQFVVSILDMGETITELISPGVVLDDILGEACQYEIGFADTSYPEDYSRVFKGIIESVESGAGYINFICNSTEYKKFQPLFLEKASDLVTPISNIGAVTTIDVVDASQIPIPYTSPFGIDNDLTYLVRINDELFSYTGKAGNQLTGVTRAQAGTIQESHAAGDTVTTCKRLNGNGIELALKIMLSGFNGPYQTGVAATSFNYIDPSLTIQDTVYFKNVFLKKEYGLNIGDLVSTAGSPNPSNVFSEQQISDLVETDQGTYLFFNGAGFTTETSTPALFAFRSQFDVFGFGLKMTPDEVDVSEFIHVRDTYLSVFDQDLIVDEIPNTKDFIEQNIFKSMACFSVPRNAKSSVAIHVGPVPGSTVKLIDIDSVINPETIRVKRSMSTNFYNKVRFKYNYDFIDGKFKSIVEYDSPESKDRITDQEKIWDIEAKGLTTANGALTKSQQTQKRILGRYRFGAEYIENLKVKFKTGFLPEIGDVVLVDYKSLKLSDIDVGSRSGRLKFMCVLNKSYDSKTAECALKLVSTNFGLTDRFGLVAPSSKCDTGSTSSKIKLQRSFGTKFYQTEGFKWRNLKGQKILVYKTDWSEFEETTLIEIDQFADPAYMIVSPALSFTPDTNHIVGPPNYGTGTDPSINQIWKARYAYLSPEILVDAGVGNDVFTVNIGDESFFRVGAVVRVSAPDWSYESVERKVLEITGQQITVDGDLGFVPNTGDFINLIGFADGGYAYRVT